MDWWPELRGFFRNAPLWITGISKEMERLKNLEENLWMDLLNEAKSSIEHGSQRASKLRRTNVSPKPVAKLLTLLRLHHGYDP